MVATELRSATRSRSTRFRGGARRILEGGLRRVATHLADIERGRVGCDVIHDLRVAARRSLAHLSLLRDVVSDRPRRWFRRRLHRLHDLAARVRDLDIVAARLGRERHRVGPHRARRLLASVAITRRAMERPLRNMAAAIGGDRWEERVARLCEPLGRGDLQRSHRHRVYSRLERVITHFRRTLRRRCHGAEAVHDLRITGKKLRYHLEAFATILPNQAVNACRDSLHDLQDRLGTCTDLTASARTMRCLEHAAHSRVERRGWHHCRRAERSAARRARRAFGDWWDDDRRRMFRRHCRDVLGESLP